MNGYTAVFMGGFYDRFLNDGIIHPKNRFVNRNYWRCSKTRQRMIHKLLRFENNYK